MRQRVEQGPLYSVPTEVLQRCAVFRFLDAPVGSRRGRLGVYADSVHADPWVVLMCFGGIGGPSLGDIVTAHFQRFTCEDLRGPTKHFTPTASNGIAPALGSALPGIYFDRLLAQRRELGIRNA